MVCLSTQPLPFWSSAPLLPEGGGSAQDSALLVTADRSKEGHLTQTRAPFPSLGFPYTDTPIPCQWLKLSLQYQFGAVLQPYSPPDDLEKWGWQGKEGLRDNRAPEQRTRQFVVPGLTFPWPSLIPSLGCVGPSVILLLLGPSLMGAQSLIQGKAVNFLDYSWCCWNATHSSQRRGWRITN